MELLQLIYLSDLVGEDERPIPDILATSARRNAQDGITGMLLYSRGNFMQVLEGPPAAVDATYARICQDPRHRNQVLLLREPVARRQFARWSMGYRQLEPAMLERCPHWAPLFQFGLREQAFQVQPGLAREMLELFSTGVL